MRELQYNRIYYDDAISLMEYVRDLKNYIKKAVPTITEETLDSIEQLIDDDPNVLDAEKLIKEFEEFEAEQYADDVRATWLASR